MRILSGIQPSGSLHIGNYFGMMKPMISYLERAELFVFIVNLHALTTVNDSEELKKNTLKAAVDFLALGLEPEKCVFWVQSDVLEVTELTWILSGVTSMGLLERCHSYKDKIAKGIVPNHGLFAYPVLMAADIILYQSNIIPVGKDQKQHVEVARDIALRFNHIFGETFVIPEPEINEDLAVVPGIDGQKMSKSYNNAIDIFTDRETLNKTIMRVVTDSTPVNEPKNPDTCNLFALYRLFAGPDKIDDLRARYLAPGLKYAEVKKELAQLIWDFFGEHREKHAELMKKQDIIRDILRDGANKARAIARETMDLVRDRVGINY
ncbi:MAG: tryptophan--tRNA ligase [Deltaproteobacteria bacterium]|nr:tryptophan--tRNA ligase [Deltaproteobacteria bacterium]MBW2052811.1 tryptophan--tRNA ligase [Deltaproteobacteria bacterium]MBW2141803.1 tryptophan--tRNA ligase [Deltaproteobacteria bacterium]